MSQPSMLSPTDPGTPWSPPPLPPTKKARTGFWAVLATVAAVAVVGIAVGVNAGNTKVSVEPGALSIPTYSVPVDTSTTDAPQTTPTDPPSPTESPSPTTANLAVGQIAHLTQDGSPSADIVIRQVSQHASYTSSDGFMTDTPPTAGYVYIQAKVTYTALANGVDYNPFDFDVFVDGIAVDNLTIVFSGPEPSLSSGTLSTGRKAQGWVVYAVPAKGKVVMSYGGNSFDNSAPLFEVMIRAH